MLSSFSLTIVYFVFSEALRELLDLGARFATGSAVSTSELLATWHFWEASGD
jgi:hypothetical protein